MHFSYVHRISFMYTWLLLLYFQLNVKRSIYELWIFQVLTLRLVGMAFEVNLAYKSKLAQKSIKKSQNEPVEKKTLINPSREQSNISSGTPRGSSLKDGRENLHTKAGLDRSADTTGPNQRNITDTRTSTGRSPNEGVPNQTTTSSSKNVSVGVGAEAKNLSLGRGEVQNDMRGERATIANENQKEDISEWQKNYNTVSGIRVSTSMLDSDVVNKDPTAVDIISYAYFFIGLHKGKVHC